MKDLNARSISLMVAILFYGILLGGVVYARLVFFPPYLSALPASAALVNGLSPAEWFARGRRWQHFSWVRGSILGLAITPLLLALITPENRKAG